jgi:LacI family transcriptional regulator
MAKEKNKIDKSKSVFIYKQFADMLRKEIQRGKFKPGEHIPSERKLSQDHNINRITVRRGINQLIKEGLLYSVPGTGTFVSEKPKSLKKPINSNRSQKKNISCMIKRLNPSIDSPILSPYYIEIFTSLQNEASRLGYNISFNFITSVKEEREIARTILESGSEGVILIGQMDEKFILSLYNKKVPMVLLDNHLEKPSIASVIPDNRRGAYEAVKYLISLGHEKIGCITAPPEQPAAIERLNGYKKALAESGIKYDKRLVVEGFYQVRYGYSAMEKLLKRKIKPTAVFAVNDEAAIGAIKAIKQEAGFSVPKDISIIGFDDIEWSQHSDPPLSTVKIFKSEMSAIAFRQLDQIIKGQSRLSSITITPVELIIRASCQKR